MLTTKHKELSQTIEKLYDSTQLPADALKTVEQVIDGLDTGEIQVVEPTGKDWHVNEWVKKAILLYFRLRPVEKMDFGPFADKIPLKILSHQTNRIVPFSSVRKGSYIAPKVVIMAPSFVNIGAYVDEGAMIDSIVLVGSCARIGKNVHLGAGTIIGGVLEPPNSQPVIVEDGAFVGGSCGIYEGCIVKKNAVIGAGTIITGKTPVIDLETGEEHFGYVPENAVVVPGCRSKQSANNGVIVSLQTPVIIKRRDPNISAKLAMEESLRVFNQS